MDTAASTSYQFGGNGGGNGGLGGGSGSDGSGSNGSGSSGSGSTGSGSVTQGFAIPINTALTIAKQIDSGQASSTVHIGATAFLGVGIAQTTQGAVQGVAIQGSEQGTAAAEAGITQGDVITALDGKSVSTGTDIQDILIGHHPGDKVSVAWTDTSGQSHTATLTLGTGPAA
jgi:S1-C subfamily serine protease